MASKLPLILITGASQGIGAAIAHVFAGQIPGVRLALVARSEKNLQRAARACLQAGATVEIFPCDVTDEGAVAAMARAVHKHFGPVDALINNAGTFTMAPFVKTTVAAFDRQIAVDRPDLKGREAILQVHAKGKPLSDDVKLVDYARRTPGFTGADLANVLNEAALLTAREEKKLITNKELDESIDRVMAGPQRKSRIMSDSERRVTAYHEAGHALVAHALPHTDPVHKITIMPRGRALGYTMVLPDEDKYSTTRNELLDQLAYSLGGRAAEELIFHDPSTGASNDIEKATALARAMVTQYGMTEAIGAIKLGGGSTEPFMGRDYGHQRDYSENIAAVVDREVRTLIENAHQEAFDILVANRKILDEMVLELLEKETLNKDDIAVIFKKVRAVTPRPAWTGSPTRIPSTQPPVDVPERIVEVEAKKTTRRKKSASDDK